jgi:hypothetical protein
VDTWTITEELDDLLICGPGNLEIVLKDFSPMQTLPSNPLPQEMLGSLRQREWSYLLEPNVELQLISTRDSTNPETPELHMLHIGSRVSWTVPAEFAERLHALLRCTQ